MKTGPAQIARSAACALLLAGLALVGCAPSWTAVEPDGGFAAVPDAGPRRTDAVLDSSARRGDGAIDPGDPRVDAGHAAPSAYPPTPAPLRDTIDALLDRGHTPGAAACVVKDGRVAWCDGFGLAHVAEGRVPTPDTPFLLASISKTITAVALMSLHEDGLFALDDDVSGVLPFELYRPRRSVPITYRALLTHTAGIRDNWDVFDAFYGYPATPDAGGVPPYTLAETMRGYFDRSGTWFSSSANWTEAGPGRSYEYANMGIALAGYLGELLSGTDFAALCDARVLRPLGLAHTSFRFADVAAFGVAMPYAWDGTSYVAKGHYTFADYPDGGLFASAADLSRFLLAIIGRGAVDGVRVLDESTVATMLMPQVPALEPTQGLVFYSSEWRGDTWWGHNGAEQGVATDMYFRVSDGLGYVLLRNGDASNDPTAADDLATALVDFAEAL